MIEPNFPISWPARILSSLTGLVLGPTIIFGGFFLLYMVDSQTNYAELAKKAICLKADEIDVKNNELPLVAVTGTINISEPLSDGMFLKPAPYLSFSRKTLVYAWEEIKNIKNTEDSSGKPIQESSTTYKSVWTERPTQTELFEHPEGHQNPTEHSPQEIQRQQKTFNLGKYIASGTDLQLPAEESLIISTQTVTAELPHVIIDNTIFSPKNPPATPMHPQIGDLKTLYRVIDAQGKTATIFGKIQNNSIGKALVKEIQHSDSGEIFYRLFWQTPKDAIFKLEQEYKQNLFWGHVIVFALFFFGLMMFLGPISALMSGVPILSNILDTTIFLISLLCAGVLFLIGKLLIELLISPIKIGLIVLALLLLSTIFIKKLKAK
jgi:hypothetical protein